MFYDGRDSYIYVLFQFHSFVMTSTILPVYVHQKR